jgi:hypothetical protein
VASKDHAGNVETPRGVYIKIDKTPPELTASMTAGALPYAEGTWTNQSVYVDFSCTDPASLPGELVLPVTVTTEGADQYLTRSCENAAGLVATETFGPINIDKTPPSAPTITSPPDGASYTVGQVVNATYTCDADTGGSGVISCVGMVGNTAVASSAPVPTATAGSFTLAVTATDGAGNVSTQARSYSVFPALGGPVDTGTLNVGKAGSKIPFMFSLGADYGLDIFADGYPKSRPMACNTGLPSDPIESTVSTPGGLRYDAATGIYHYTWATDRTWAGSCRQLILRFAASGVGEYSGGEIVFAFSFR